MKFNMTRAEWIRWLSDAITVEVEKPFDEIDYDFVEECSLLLDEMMGVSQAMTSEEIAARMAELRQELADDDAPKAIKTSACRCGKAWKVIIILAAVLCVSVATVFAVPQLRTAVLSALQLDVGDAVEDGGISYIRFGETTQYASMDELIEKENLNILSFDDPTGELEVEAVTYFAESDNTIIAFNDESIDMKLLHNVNNIDDSIKANSERTTYGNFEVYEFEKSHKDTLNYYAYFYYGDITYMIQCQSKETLVSVITSLNEGK